MNFSLFKKLSILAFLFVCGLIQNSYAQTTSNNYSLIDNLQPVTPTSWQFEKYDQLPVSEYTGTPDISVPLYEISEDGVKIPIQLSYHAGGIKVNEDASWVGLGWDMTFGSIVQQINDQDDFESGVTHLQSDYINTGNPFMYPYKYNYCYNGIPSCNTPCQSSVPVTSVNANCGLVIYTGQYAPFNGIYNQLDYMHYFDDHVYYKVDSEPDVFTANFFGYSFKFIMQWNPQQIIVLDKKGYKVSRNGNAWTVVVPSGDEYIFAVQDSIQTISSSQGITGQSSPDPELPSSNIWMLTQIITRNRKVITFNYTQTATKPCFPQFSQKGISTVLEASGYTGDPTSFCRPSNVGPSAISATSTLNTASYSFEPYTYLSSITFPNGTITFNLSSRTDITGGLKLDSLAITSNQIVKKWKFNYSYFNSSGVGGNLMTFDTIGISNDQVYRLQLLSMQDNSGAKYSFTYNSTLLPARNSFAIDYWGYYNGDLSNASFVPNATQFNQTNYPTNSDNHSANLAYAQAGTLTQIQYPTGGTVTFTYALNQFNNYWVPDYSSSTNTVSSGDGLRTASITWKDAAGNQLKKTNYTYSTGLASIPLNFFRTYVFSTVVAGTYFPSAPLNYNSYSVYESCMNGYFSANPFASFNGIGYSQVTKTDVDNSGNADGKTVTNYYNTPDLIFNAEGTIAQIDPTLPAYKNPSDTAENGSIKSELVYDGSNHLLKKTVDTYTKVTSALYPAARVMSYADYVNYTGAYDGDTFNQALYPQSAVGYYPMYDFETLMSSSKVTDYFVADSVTNLTSYAYDVFNQPWVITKNNSTYLESTELQYTYSISGQPTHLYPAVDSMFAHNRLTDIVRATKSTPNSTTTFIRNYRQIGNLFVANIDTSYNANYGNIPNLTTYDQYDPSNGNIWQYSQNTVPSAILWDYNKEYVIAMAKNAAYTNIAYTSFEADGTGRWKFTGTTTPDPAAPAGQKVYSLANGNIYRDSLNATLTYVVSYWSKSGAQTVGGSTATKTGFTFNGYTYYEHTIPTPTSGTITVSGAGTIDELRLYPNTAQMTSYTYNPLVGISSEDNAGGKIAYYEYDYAMRLLDIRDQYRHILKAYCYNYAGQPTNCGVNITYSSAVLSQSFTRNNCSSGYVGSSLTYTVPAGKYTSTMSQQDANNQAQEDMTANGQANANTNGSCVVPPAITDIQYGGHGTGYTQVIFTTIPSCSTTIINYKDLTTNTPYTDAGSCTSPRYETLTVGHNYQFTITCYSTAFPSGITSAPYNYTPND